MRNNDAVAQEKVFSPLVEHAIELSAQWHDQTYRKGRWREPAFEVPADETHQVPVTAHLTATAMIVQRAGWREEAVAAAFLHDVLEDVNRYNDRMVHEQLRRHVGEDVTDLVDAVTERKRDAEGRPRAWRLRKEEYLDHLEEASPAAMAISLADKMHNLWTMNQSMEQGVSIFKDSENHKGLNAGPEEQRWFFQAVLEVAREHEDEDKRLVPMRAHLEEELDRFKELTAEL